MKDYTKDPSIPLPIASLLNDAQSDPVIDSVGYYAHMLGAAEATIKALREALEPFAQAYEAMTAEDLAVDGVEHMEIERILYRKDQPKIGDLVRAARVLGCQVKL